MARPRFWAILLVGVLLPTVAPRAAMLFAQTSSSGQSTALSYDDLAAAEKRAAAEKEAAALKHGKKEKRAETGASPASAPPASSPSAAKLSATTAAGPAATEPSVDPTPAPAASTVSTPTDPTVAAPVAAVATSAPATADVSAPAADGTVPPAKTAENDTDATADATTPKVAPKMQRTLFGKMKPVKEKAPKLVPVTIMHGELTVDGLIAKAGLNFQIADMKYFYIWVPGLGTTIVSNEPFPGSHIQVNALDGSTLTVAVEGHQLQLACDRDILGGKKPKALSVFVALDRNFDKSSIYPEFGYGTTVKAPYNWPGTLADLHPNTKAPPLPANLRQNTESLKMCHKNEDGTQGACRTVDVPMVVGKTS